MSTEAPTRLESFPEIVQWHPKCLLCLLVHANPNVVYTVHELYRRGLSGMPLVDKVRPVFEEAGEKLPSRQAFQRHFEGHCAILVGAPSLKHGTHDQDHEADYFELRQLYREFKVIFSQIRDEFSQTRAKGDKKVSDYGLVMLVNLARELRSMLKTLSDMRNSEKLVTIILLRHTEQLVHLMTEPLGQSLREIRDRLTRGEDPHDVARRLDDLLGTELYPLFETAAQQAIEQSKQQYKLH